jgi:RimJ/RimL family protein N-acetyltransferase
MTENQIILRNVRREDLPHLLEWWKNPLIKKAQRVERFNPTLDDVEKIYDSDWKDVSPEKYVLLVVELDEEPIGEVGYHYYEGSTDEMGVDIKIGHPDLWRQGIGTRAMQQLIWLVFDKHPVNALMADVGELNLASRTLFSKCGFIEVARKEIPANKIFDGGTAVVMRLERQD